MKSYNVPVHSEADRLGGLVKKQWTKPSVETLVIESAEGGSNPNRPDGNTHATKTRS
jgi:hypothetical protein